MTHETTRSSSGTRVSVAAKPEIDIHPTASALLTPSLLQRLDAAAIAAVEMGNLRGIPTGHLIATGFESYEDDYQAVTLKYIVEATDDDAAALWADLAKRVYQQSVEMANPSVHELTTLEVEVDWGG